MQGAFGSSAGSMQWDPTKRPMYSVGEYTKQNNNMWQIIFDSLISLIPGGDTIIRLITDITSLNLADIGALFGDIPGAFLTFLTNIIAWFQHASIDITRLITDFPGAARNVVQYIISPTGLLATLDEFGNMFVGQLPVVVKNIINGVQTLFGNIGSGIWDVEQAIEDFILNLLRPTGLLAWLGLDGKLPDGQAPNIIQRVIDSIVNGFNSIGQDITGHGTDILHQVFQSVAAAISAFQQQGGNLWYLVSQLGANIHTVMDNLQSNPAYVDAEDFVDNAVAAVAGLASGFVGVISNLFTALTGQSRNLGADGELPGDSTNTATELSHAIQTLTAHSIALNELKSVGTGGANSGLAASDNFGTPYSPGAGPDWTIVSSNGINYADTTIRPGELSWHQQGSATASLTLLRTNANDRHTKTDWQIIGMVIGSRLIDTPFFSSAPHNDIYGRVNDAFTQYIRAEISDSQAQLRYANGGAEVVCPSDTATADIRQAVGVEFDLYCGDNTAIGDYALYRNGIRAVTFTDSPTTPLIATGASNRGWALGFGAGGYGSVQKVPSSVTSVTVADNIPTDTVGEGFKVFRSATSGVSHASGTKVEDVYDTVDRISPDAAWGSGKVTINTAGWWIFTLRTQASGQFTGTGAYRQGMYLTRNGVGTVVDNGAEHVNSVTGVSVTGGGNSTNVTYAGVKSMRDVYMIYCEIGDTVEPYMVSLSTSISIVGSADALATYFGGTLASGESIAAIAGASA